MIDLHPNYIIKDGKREFVVLTYEEFSHIQELLEDLEDLRDLRKAKDSEGDAPGIPLEEVKAKIGMA